jgi:hypothetical protein
MLISNAAGMGKSTLLTHLSKRIKQKFPAKWVVRLDLNDHTDALKSLKQEQFDKQKAIDFVSGNLLKLEPGLEMELFKQCCEQQQKVRIVIMMDGFDEISPFYKQTVIDLLQALRETAVEQLWVTTRPHLREELEDKLQQLSYTLEPFSEGNQLDFLTKFWSLKEWFTETEGKGDEKGKSKLKIYAELLIENLAYSIGDKDREFTGIPLLTRMLAEAFDEAVKTFYQSAEPNPKISCKLDLLGLYERFIERKYDIYQEEKFQVTMSNVIATEQRKRDLKHMTEDHQLLAFKLLFTKEQLALFQNNRECSFSAEQLTRIGIVQVSHDGKPHFIHRTFAEYFVADCLVDRLREGNNTSEQVLDFILKDIFLKDDYRVIRGFVDGLLLSFKPSKQALKECGNHIHGLLKDSQLDGDDDEDDDVDDDDDDNDDAYDDVQGLYDTWHDSHQLLHRTASEGNTNIIGFLLDSAQAADDTYTVNKLLLAQDEERRTALYQAVFWRNIQVLEKLRECAKGNLTTEEVKNKLLLGTDNKGKTAWHVAVEWGNLETLQKVWEWAEEKLTTEEIKNELILGTDNKGGTAWHIAVRRGRSEILRQLWKWAKEKLTTDEINHELLLGTGNEGWTDWQVEEIRGNLEKIVVVWKWTKEKLITEEIKHKLLLSTHNEGWTDWQVEVTSATLMISEVVWERAKRN